MEKLPTNLHVCWLAEVKDTIILFMVTLFPIFFAGDDCKKVLQGRLMPSGGNFSQENQ